MLARPRNDLQVLHRHDKGQPARLRSRDRALFGADDELLFLLENAMETTKSLEARGLYFGLAISAMRSEVEMLAHMATARGLKP